MKLPIKTLCISLLIVLAPCFKSEGQVVYSVLGNKIQKYLNGVSVGVFADAGLGNEISAITTNSSGDVYGLINTPNWYEQKNFVNRYSSTGQLISSFFVNPADGGYASVINVSETGKLYVGWDNGKVTQYDLNGNLIRKFGQSNGNRGLTTDIYGNVYIVAGYDHGGIDKFSEDGTYLLNMIKPGFFPLNETTLATSADGFLYAHTNISGHSIEKWTLDGNYISSFGGGWDARNKSLSVDSSGNVYQTTDGIIRKYGAEGTFQDFGEATMFYGRVNLAIANVPEPSALSLLAIGLGGLAILRRGRKED